MRDEDLVIKPNRNAQIKRRSSFALGLLAASLSGLSAILLALQWNETRLGTRVLRDSFIADHRPLLEINDIKYIMRHGFSFVLRNTGKNTAANIRLYSGFEIWREYVAHYDAKLPINFNPDAWSSWHIKLHEQVPNGYSPLPNIASGTTYTGSVRFGEVADKRLALLYARLPEIAARVPDAFRVLLKGTFIYAEPSGRKYDLTYCLEERETLERERSIELLPCR